MGHLLVHSDVHRSAVEVRGDHIPGHAPLYQVIERREAAREQVRMFEGHCGSHTEAHVLGDCCHRRDGTERIVHRNLRSILERHLGRAAIDIVYTDHIGDEQAIEMPALELDGHVGPVIEVVIARRLTLRVPPGPRRLVGDACHVECVQDDSLLVTHTLSPWWIHSGRLTRRLPANYSPNLLCLGIRSVSAGSPSRRHRPVICLLRGRPSYCRDIHALAASGRGASGSRGCPRQSARAARQWM